MNVMVSLSNTPMAHPPRSNPFLRSSSDAPPFPYSAEQIVAKLREAEKLQAQGLTIPQACKRLGISDHDDTSGRVTSDTCGGDTFDYGGWRDTTNSTHRRERSGTRHCRLAGSDRPAAVRRVVREAEDWP